MISWMQRHRKYLVVTIWISTIAFIGAGFVGWGQYSYGSRASAVAKVGDIDITARELQGSYSNLYNQYSRLFQGNFDEAQAKSFGLDKMALQQLIDQALILNLAESYGLLVSDAELWETIKAQKVFFKDGGFDKESYEKALSQNNLTIKDYEADVRKSLLIRKTLALFPTTTREIEKEALAALTDIADKVSYKVLTGAMITVPADDSALLAYWEGHKNDYMMPARYTLETVTQQPVTGTPEEAELQEYYAANRTAFTGTDGKILEFEAARPLLVEAVNDKAAHKASLRQYIAFKKGELAADETLEVSEDDYPFSADLFKEITALTPEDPFLKPRKVGESYKSIKLVSVTPAQPKSFEAAKSAVHADYVREEREKQLQELAKNSVATFSGKTTPFITREYARPLEGLNATESQRFVNELFAQQSARGIITIDNTKVVLFHILEQQLLKTPQTDLEDSALRMKSTLLDRGLIEMLRNKYPTEIYLDTEGR